MNGVKLGIPFELSEADFTKQIPASGYPHPDPDPDSPKTRISMPPYISKKITRLPDLPSTTSNAPPPPAPTVHPAQRSNDRTLTLTLTPRPSPVPSPHHYSGANLKAPPRFVRLTRAGVGGGEGCAFGVRIPLTGMDGFVVMGMDGMEWGSPQNDLLIVGCGVLGPGPVRR